MTIYTKTTDFQAKDVLASGNPLKIVKGTEIDDEFDAIATADATNLKKDGTVTATANIPMGTYKFTGLGSGSAATDSANLGQVQAGAYQLIGSISGVDTITGTLSPAITAYAAGQKFSFVSAGANTGAATININSLGAKSITKLGTTALAAGDIPSGALVEIGYDGTRFQLGNIVANTVANLSGGSAGTIPYQSAAGTTAMLAAGTAGQALLATGASAPIMGIPVLRGYIDGLILSTAGSSTTMSISAGVAADSTNVFVMSGSAISKTTSAWAVGTGNGGIDTGSIAANTWYYFYLIRRPDTGVVDVVFSASASSPTLPTNYTQYRYIGAAQTNGSSQWIKFIQYGDRFYWDAPVLDVAAVAAGTSAVTRTLSVPRRRVLVLGEVNVSSGVNGEAVYLSDLAVSDLASTSTASPGTTLTVPASTTAGAQFSVVASSNGQIRSRLADGASGTFRIFTLGWVDSRGMDA